MNKYIKRHCNLGSRSLYVTNDSDIKYKNINDMLDEKKSYTIQSSSILSFMMKNYIIGDETIIKGIKKEKWFHDQNNFTGENTPNILPSHGRLELTNEEIGDKLRLLLLDEARYFLNGKKTIGLLLSGGMDSRVVAGIIRELQENGEFLGDVVALTWGIETTRDVIYSRRIAKKFNWEHKHFKLNSETLIKNIYITAERGAEYSPLHLHAMSDISKLSGLDGILAGSYGDSVGRAEFSGKKVQSINSLLNDDFNKFALLNSRIKKENLPFLIDEIDSYHKCFSRESLWEYYEIDRQCHYMRRQLGACMDIIDDNIPLYQMFTDISVFGFMWSLSPKCRTDSIYTEVLKKLPGDLLTIPWARDGKLYPGQGEVCDNIEASHNLYGIWLRTECSTVIENAIYSGALESLNIFNPYTLSRLKHYWKKSKSNGADRFDERISWMASLSLLVEKYNIKSEYFSNNDYKEYLFSLKGYTYSTFYRNARHILKK
ncbi:asparagine synthase-related protein [Photobacterium piscicola]|uniref:asparagine synthase (glutamine-hydrolyzing) n=1 Tax=Photobacterium piscicola TaxID=1378299 RepID=A0ABU6LHW7_9GAMM|nr:asparagine synthase-related protein [Photobacterium piscicola]